VLNDVRKVEPVALADVLCICHALTLKERIALLGQLRTVPSERSGADLINLFEGVAQISPKSLHAYGVSDPTALQAIRVPVDLLAELLFPTRWLDNFSARYRDAPKTVQFAPGGFGVCDAFWPLISSASADVQYFMEQCSNDRSGLRIDFEPVVQSGQAHLYERLFSASARTLVVELGAAHALKLLHGRTSRQRLAFFVDCLRESSFSSKILAQYPVLMRQAVSLVEDWRDALIEFLGRLAQDWKEISAEFFASRDCGPLCAIEITGDSHAKGRATIVASFANAEKLVYKPRSLRVDVHFAQLVEWVNKRSMDFEIGAGEVLDKESYGWSKFIPHEPCRSIKQVRLFYRRQGANLALLYLLGGNDAHSENLIAHGEVPKIVDLETLFHPRLALEGLGGGIADTSVLATGLLPRQRTNELEPWVDLSALGNAGGEEFPLDLPTWENVDSDKIRLVHARQKMSANRNLPLLRGRRVRSSSFVNEVIDGFAAMYGLFCKHRAGLLAADGPIAMFKGDITRVVVRATLQYGLLLQESFHPKCLRNALERETAFDVLWGTTSDHELLARLIAAERGDLWRGDIPVFYTRTDVVDLWTASGEQIVRAFNQSGLDSTMSRAAALDEKDLERQTQAIRSGMGAVSPGRRSRRSAGIAGEEIRQAPTGANDTALLKDAVARYVGALKNFSFSQLEATQEPPYASVAMGGAGIAYALWKASRQLNDENLLAHANQWIVGALAAVGKADAFTAPQFDLDSAVINGGSVFYGLAGLYYVRALIADAMRDVTAKDQAIADFKNLVETVRSVSLDLMSGAPGQLLAIAHLRAGLDCQSLDATGQRLYERVLATDRKSVV